MAEFHETGYGKRFFDSQLPQLIAALERIATALEAREQAAPCPSCGSTEGSYVPPKSGDAHCLHCGEPIPPKEG